MMHKVGSLWKKKTSEGKPYLSGSALGIKVLVYPVKEKKSANSPDYTLSIEFPGDQQQKKEIDKVQRVKVEESDF